MCLAACKSKPVPPVPFVRPRASLHFVSIEAHDVSRVSLDYTLKVENPTPADAAFIIEEWNIVINDREMKAEDLNLILGEKDVFSVEPGTGALPGVREIPVRLELDIPSLASAGVPLKDDFTVELVLDMFHTDVLRAPYPMQARETTVFPYIREPVFTITAIAILKAELINTRFRVGLRIDNPNPFPVELSAFSYKLYGNGRFWADGTEENIIRVAGKSTLTGNLFLMMNFIDMPRTLLDQIINLIDVNYRFTGEAEIMTGVEYLPKFKSGFDLSGYSQVLDK